MSNTCFTEIEIHCTNQHLLHAFCSNVTRWLENPITIGSTTYRYSLYNLAINSLLTTVEDINNGAYHNDLRGSIHYVKYKDDYVLIDTQTALVPKIDMIFDLMCRELDDSARLVYRGGEAGKGIYVTNDPKFENKFCLEINKDDDDGYEVFYLHEDCLSDDDVIENLQDISYSDSNDVMELIEIAEKKGYHISLNSWDYFRNYQKEEA